MSNIKELKQAALTAIDANRARIIAIGKQIFANPELGYKEVKTSALVREVFGELGLKFTDGHAVTGMKARVKGAESRAAVCVMGEMDAVVCPTHKYADAQTGAAHSCGHHAQVAAMLGTAMGLLPIMKDLCGDVVFFAVPAEEYVEIAYRESLRKEGKIHYFGGKQQLIAEGAFDDVDMALMVHSTTDMGNVAAVPNGGLGFIGKTVRFKGRAAHAASPHMGVNALNAATIALTCINGLRETFRDEDGVRVHPIITKGGDLVNVVPADVRMETYVRANNIDAIRTANAAVTRAIRGAAYAMGVEVEITDFEGYVPYDHNEMLADTFAAEARELLGAETVVPHGPFSGSTDVSDLGLVIPVIQPVVGGFTGAAHSEDFAVSDEEWAYIVPAKLMAMTVIDLLADGAEKALAVKASQPRGSAKTYGEMWDALLGKNDADKLEALR